MNLKEVKLGTQLSRRKFLKYALKGSLVLKIAGLYSFVPSTAAAGSKQDLATEAEAETPHLKAERILDLDDDGQMGKTDALLLLGWVDKLILESNSQLDPLEAQKFSQQVAVRLNERGVVSDELFDLTFPFSIDLISFADPTVSGGASCSLEDDGGTIAINTNFRDPYDESSNAWLYYSLARSTVMVTAATCAEFDYSSSLGRVSQSALATDLITLEILSDLSNNGNLNAKAALLYQLREMLFSKIIHQATRKRVPQVIGPEIQLIAANPLLTARAQAIDQKIALSPGYSQFILMDSTREDQILNELLSVAQTAASANPPLTLKSRVLDPTQKKLVISPLDLSQALHFLETEYSNHPSGSETITFFDSAQTSDPGGLSSPEIATQGYSHEELLKIYTSLESRLKQTDRFIQPYPEELAVWQTQLVAVFESLKLQNSQSVHLTNPPQYADIDSGLQANALTDCASGEITIKKNFINPQDIEYGDPQRFFIEAHEDLGHKNFTCILTQKIPPAARSEHETSANLIALETLARLYQQEPARPDSPQADIEEAMLTGLEKIVCFSILYKAILENRDIANLWRDNDGFLKFIAFDYLTANWAKKDYLQSAAYDYGYLLLSRIREVQKSGNRQVIIRRWDDNKQQFEEQLLDISTIISLLDSLAFPLPSFPRH